MEYLARLVSHVPYHKIKHLSRLGIIDPSCKIGQLFKGMTEEQWKSEQEAMADLYPQRAKGDSRIAFSKLKTELKKRLLQLVILIDPAEDVLPRREKKILDCYRTYTAGLFLLRRGGRKAAIPLLQTALQQAEKVQVTAIALEAARLLRYHAAVIEGRRKEYERYHQKVKTLMDLYCRELSADAMQEDLLSHYVRDKSPKPELKEKASAYRRSIGQAPQELRSLRLQHRFFSLQVLEQMIAHNYAETSRKCEQALAHFQRLPGPVPRSILRTYWFQILVCSLQLKDADQGKQALSELSSILKEGSSNWLKAQELTCVYHLHFSPFQRAYDHWNQTVGQPVFYTLYAPQRETWTILEAFIQFLIASGEVTKTSKKDHRSFRLGRFLNEVPVYARDKRGYNIPILIIHLLFLLHRKDWDKAMDRIEALQRYAGRYVRKRDAKRSFHFIRMLDQLPRNGFRRSWVRERAQKRWEELRRIAPHEAGEPFEVEIIPYERLWELTLKQLL